MNCIRGRGNKRSLCVAAGHAVGYAQAMNLRGHIIVSGIAGGVLSGATGEPVLAAVTVGAGVLPDLDHLLDYYNWYVRRSPERLILLLHGWEILALLAAIYALAVPETWMLAIVIGYATQIAGDQIYNRPKWKTYIFVLRAINRFRWHGIVDKRPADRAYESLVASVPIYRGPLRRWFRGRADALPGSVGQERHHPSTHR